MVPCPSTTAGWPARSRASRWNESSRQGASIAPPHSEVMAGSFGLEEVEQVRIIEEVRRVEDAENHCEVAVGQLGQGRDGAQQFDSRPGEGEPGQLQGAAVGLGGR